jgi:hypothetical protein
VDIPWGGVVQTIVGGAVATSYLIYVRFADRGQRRTAFRAQARALITFANVILESETFYQQAQLLDSVVDRLNLVLFGSDTALALDSNRQDDAYALPLLLADVQQWAKKVAPLKRDIEDAHEANDMHQLTEEGMHQLVHDIESVSPLENGLKIAKQSWSDCATRVLRALA